MDFNITNLLAATNIDISNLKWNRCSKVMISMSWCRVKKKQKKYKILLLPNNWRKSTRKKRKFRGWITSDSSRVKQMPLSTAKPSSNYWLTLKRKNWISTWESDMNWCFNKNGWKRSLKWEVDQEMETQLWKEVWNRYKLKLVYVLSITNPNSL